jgi:DNA replication and repair protein RecF
MATSSLFIQHLHLHQFRSYPALHLDVNDQIVVLAGPNGAGKTNVLEALSLLTPMGGFRKASLEDYSHVANGSFEADIAPKGWAINAHFETIYGSQKVQAALVRRQDEASEGDDLDDEDTDVNGRKRSSRAFKVNGRPLKTSAEFASYIHMIWLTPQMDRIFIDQAQYRRRFFDLLVSNFDPQFSGLLTKYSRLLRDRAKLLRERHPDMRWIRVIEEQIVQIGVALSAARLDFLRCFEPYLRHASESFASPLISISNWVEESLLVSPAIKVEAEWLSKLEKSRAIDMETGGAQVGSHKMDLTVLHPEKKIPAKHCSTGEQKSFLISMILAEAKMLKAEKGIEPILLLDEVAAHLDEHKKKALFEEILKTGAQTWITTTEYNLFSAFQEKLCYYNVLPGTITKILV